jgi:hypothetical protein
MFKVGTVGVANVKNRVTAAQGPNDGPAKPLVRRYAIYKSKHGLRNVRDLKGFGIVYRKSFSKRKNAVVDKKVVGHMMDNLAVRTVSENTARAGFSTEIARIKARANQQRQEFMVFSPKNQAKVREAAQLVLNESKSKLLRATAGHP